MKQQSSGENEAIEQHKTWTWVKDHKKQLIAAGISITVLVGIILGMKNKDTLSELWKSLHRAVEENPTPTIKKSVQAISTAPNRELLPPTNIIDFPVVKPERTPFDVSSHLRNLPEGMSASSEKIRTALEHGFELHPGQTWVESYTKGSYVA